MRSHTPGTLRWLKTSPGSLAFQLSQKGRWARVFTEVVKPELITWAGSHHCPAAAGNLFNVTWEAVQNALNHGARIGGKARIRCHHAPPATLEVTITQDLDWPNWHLALDTSRIGDLARSDEGFGTFIMLRLSREAVFLPEERSVRLRFSCPAQVEET
jgi:hypothetical protein